MVVYLDNNYPKNLAEALRLLHELQQPQDFEIIRTQDIENVDVKNSVIFLFDKSKKGLDIITDKHFEAGFKVFAFKLNSTDAINFFQLTLMTLRLWPKVLYTINEENNPFVYTFNYNGNVLQRLNREYYYS